MVNVERRSTGLRGIELREVRRWVAGRMGDVRHERRVTRVATALFDLTADLHGLGRGERRLLRAGALLHDIGRTGGAEGHDVRGAREILRGEVPGVPNDIRPAVAYLVRYHRGAVPERRREARVDPGISFRTAQTLLALLRCADGLDRRRFGRPTLVMRRGRRGIKITCHVNRGGRAARRAFGRKKKYRLLEEVLGVGVRVEVCG